MSDKIKKVFKKSDISIARGCVNGTKQFEYLHVFVFFYYNINNFRFVTCWACQAISY